MSDGPLPLADALAGVLAAVHGDGPVAVEDLRRLSGGASRETWAFTLRRPDGSPEELILRRDPPGGGGPGTLAGGVGSGMAREARAIRAAAEAGVPVPRVVTVGDDPAVLGSAFMVMERVEGETIPRRILREPALARARGALAAECGRALARLHSVPAAAVPGLDGGDQLVRYREVLDAVEVVSPTFELAFRWLEERRPAPAPPVLVHGDFRNGNLMVGPGGLAAVLDWELAHGGDGTEDLAWLCVRSWRFGSPLPVGGFGTVEDLLAAYEGAGGRPVDRESLRWWEVFGNLRWGIICGVQVAAHTSGARRSVELAAIGRRICEVEWDLLGLLG